MERSVWRPDPRDLTRPLTWSFLLCPGHARDIIVVFAGLHTAE
jgi:hypothetical protein